MAHTETTGYGARLIASIRGVLFGVVLFLVSFPLLWWNEGRAVQTARGLAEGASTVVPVDGFDAANEGKLVHFTGQATTDEVLTDPTFGVKVSALRFERRVEMFQWFEQSSGKENLGGSKTTTYTYATKWSPTVINSASFKEAGHDNPKAMPVRPDDIEAKGAKLGPFDLSPSIIESSVDRWESLPPALFEDAVATKLGAQGVSGIKVTKTGDVLYLGNDPAQPVVGDSRIGYRLVRAPLTLSIVGQQTGRGFGAYSASGGHRILMAVVGSQDAATMFSTAEAANASLTWALRGVGWLMMTLGLWLIVRPIAMFVNFVPLAGSFVSFGAFLLASAIASGLSLVTIAVAWLAYRPILGASLLATSLIGFMVATKMMASARARARAKALVEAPPDAEDDA